MCLFKRKARISGIWFIRVLINKDSYAICFQCSSPHLHSGICPWEVQCKCEKLIELHGGLTYRSKCAYVKKEI